jgi:hypothetical protein
MATDATEGSSDLNAESRIHSLLITEDIIRDTEKYFPANFIHNTRGKLYVGGNGAAYRMTADFLMKSGYRSTLHMCVAILEMGIKTIMNLSTRKTPLTGEAAMKWEDSLFRKLPSVTDDQLQAEKQALKSQNPAERKAAEAIQKMRTELASQNYLNASRVNLQMCKRIAYIFLHYAPQLNLQTDICVATYRRRHKIAAHDMTIEDAMPAKLKDSVSQYQDEYDRIFRSGIERFYADQEQWNQLRFLEILYEVYTKEDPSASH